MNGQFLQDSRARRPILIVDMAGHQAFSLNSEKRAQQIAESVAWEYPPDNLDEFLNLWKKTTL
jgi:hypothetical protein